MNQFRIAAVRHCVRCVQSQQFFKPDAESITATRLQPRIIRQFSGISIFGIEKQGGQCGIKRGLAAVVSPCSHNKIFHAAFPAFLKLNAGGIYRKTGMRRKARPTPSAAGKRRLVVGEFAVAVKHMREAFPLRFRGIIIPVNERNALGHFVHYFF